MKAADSESTGLDSYHGCQPFFTTIAKPDDIQLFWEWDVDPLTRQVQAIPSDIEEIKYELFNDDDDPDNPGVVLQNSKFDIGMWAILEGWDTEWLWDNDGIPYTFDTLIGAHLLASNQPKDLTTLAAVYLDINIKPYEDAIKEATKAIRSICRSRLPEWKIAREGMPELPSAKGELWQNDMWLARALVKYVIFTGQYDLLPPHEQQPTVVHISKTYDVLIDRRSKWGNPFLIGKDGTREDVIRKYASWIWNNPSLLADLPELYGKTLGCHCKPLQCHGDILRALCHPWFRVLQKYSLIDSTCTLLIQEEMVRRIKGRDLWEIYLERLKVLKIAYSMQREGITLSSERRESLVSEYKEESDKCRVVCESIALTMDYALVLPKSGNSNSLSQFVFGREADPEKEVTAFPGLDVPRLNVSAKTGNPSLAREVLDQYLEILSPNSKEHWFFKNLSDKRQRDTALAYMQGYTNYWIAVDVDPITGAGWYRLHPWLNPTGTNTLRWSSKSPNEQNISKREGFNLRYLFGPMPDEEWWSCDAQNIELRLPAYEAGEEAMIQLFERPNDPPFYGSNHLLNFSIVYPKLWEKHGKDVKKLCPTEYGYTKNGGFAIQYGAVDRDDGDGTADRAFHVKGAHAKLKARLGKITRLTDQMFEHATKYGYVETIPDKTVNPRRGYPLECTRTRWGGIKPTVPLSYHIQGTAMWWMMGAMIRCTAQLDEWNKEIGYEAYKMLMQIHDEIVFCFPKGKGKEPWKTNLPKVRKLMHLMRIGGDNIGIPTPVSCEYHQSSWDKGISI